MGGSKFQEPIECISEIGDFYAGATIFITGGTGFLGKLLIEKLLRSCPDINKIYVLVRQKKGKDFQTRFQEIFDEPIFKNLMKDRLLPPEKLEAIAGDCAFLGLGISEEDNIKLRHEVSIVFHGAATVRFDEKLKIAVNINMRGTREILELVKTFNNLQALIYVSTAFAHCPRNEIGEKFYNVPFQVKDLFELVEGMDDSNMELLTPTLVKPWPNTYAYTKAAAEEVVRVNGRNLPVAIVRPSIVITTALEPLAGWIDNLYGPIGIVVGVGAGLIKTLHCNPNCIADLVPADFVINVVIAAAWDIAKQRSKNLSSKSPFLSDLDPKIFNYVSYVQNPITWSEFMSICSIHGAYTPVSKAIWYYGCFSLTNSKYMNDVRVMLRHTLPAVLIDTMLRIVGKKPMLKMAYQKINKLSGVISYFTTKQWIFTNENTQKLTEDMSKQDQKTFNFDMSLMSWEDVLNKCVHGCRLYVIKEGVETIPSAIVRMKRFKMAHYTLKALVWLGLFFVLYKLFDLINILNH